MRIRLPRTKGYVSIKDLKNLNPNLHVVKIRRKFRLKIKKRL